MAAYKLLKRLKQSLQRIENIKPNNFIGKWIKSIKVKSIQCRINEIEKDLKNRKNKI
jgi:hypothetical protein